MNSLYEIGQWCGAAALLRQHKVLITELSVDSRRINDPATTLFVALRTSRRDGHDYLRAAWQQGVRSFIVSRKTPDSLPDANILLVPDTLAALQAIAAGHRSLFDIPVIGITGSNGKTVVKEWLYSLTSEAFNAVRSPKSYNSQIGVPLSVWLLGPENKLGIFEAGISRPREMERLEPIIRPTIGIFTNVGEAHGENFMNVRHKIFEKLALFRQAKHLIYCRDYPDLDDCVMQYRADIRNREEEPPQLFTWSQKSKADLHIASVSRDGNHTDIVADYSGRHVSIRIPFTGPAPVENAINCWCALLLLGMSDADITTHMASLQPVAMRLELRHGSNDCTIINDSYNSDLTSLNVALDYLEEQKQHDKHTVILSDLLQIARSETELYNEVADMVSRRSVQRFIGIGPAIFRNKDIFRKRRKMRSFFFESTTDFLKNFHLLTFSHEAILLKGARVFAFEQISVALEREVHQTMLSIDLSALVHNLNVFRRHIGPAVKTMAMVKAFSYGAGSFEIAQALEFAGVDYLSVAYTDEGVALRKAGITAPIMVMSPDAIAFDRMIFYKLEPELFSIRSLAAFTQAAQTLEAENYPVHIKLDTGMHRLGFMENELSELLRALHKNSRVHVASIFSHLAAAEDPAQDAFTAQQAAAFRRMTNKISAALGFMPMRHLANTAGIVCHPQLDYEMVRLGLGLYGIDSSGTLQQELQPIGTLTTTIAQIKHIPAGETIGYGRKGGGGNHAMRIATISIGYADGYPRALGNGRGHVLIHGQAAPVTGVVCMDMCMVDITHIPDAREGDEVVVFSPQLPVTQLAEWAGTIAYELMTGISQRVKRVYVNES